ncbi:MAG TPA: hypothetical protein ENI96_06775 [Sedimenticola thiotaurini]|uniref:Uncharacterized protein n=1 Tax=Sedimenticola thiotaurini TaxID=1543721 RepID=A0A831RNE7_9GAMM|nr:hypothetical protein [Sedimenticola thiotaurini]
MLPTWLMRLYVTLIAVVSLASLAYVYLAPLPGLQQTRDGVPYFTPRVAHPETGEPLELGELIRHFRGD